MRWPCILAAVVSASTALAGGPIGGPVLHVIDGDTIDLADVRIRLHGIDAPEHDQEGGPEARAKLAELIEDRVVACEPKGTSRRRIVARCTVDGRDLGDAMVRAGHAIDWPKYSGGAYAAAERQAETERAGQWAKGRFVAPWLWRDRHGREPLGPTRR